jgi:hypothetical protein
MTKSAIRLSTQLPCTATRGPSEGHATCTTASSLFARDASCYEFIEKNQCYGKFRGIFAQLKRESSMMAQIIIWEVLRN